MKYLVYCEGRGYMDKKRYDKDVAQERATERVVQIKLDDATTSKLEAALQAPQKYAANQQQPLTILPQIANFMGRITQMVFTPVQKAAVMLANVIQLPFIATSQALHTVKNVFEK